MSKSIAIEEGMVLGNFESHHDLYKIVQEALQYFTKGKKKDTYTLTKKHYMPGSTCIYVYTCYIKKVILQ